MNKHFFLFIIIILLNYCISIYTKNAYYIVAIIREETDQNYYDESKEIQYKIDKLVNDRMNDIYDIIIDNKESYLLQNGEMDKKLDELNEIPSEKLNDKTKQFLFINKNKSNNNSKDYLNNNPNPYFNSNNTTIEYIPFQSNLIRHVCPINNYYAISVYLSELTLKKIHKLENIHYYEESLKLNNFNKDKVKYIQNINKKENKNKNIKKRDNINSPLEIYYDIDAIKKETNWTAVNVQPFIYHDYPNHLSLISQGINYQDSQTYDENFYFPDTAGQGIDIFIVDYGVLFHHQDFNTYKDTPYERTISCDAISNYGRDINTSESEKFKCQCFETDDPYIFVHGTAIASMAGGTLFGVAKKANLHMVVTDFETDLFLQTLDFILQHGKPHKTVISMSVGLDRYDQLIEDKFQELIKKGYIYIIAAGNDGVDYCKHVESGSFYDVSIMVGAVNSEIVNNKLIATDYTNFGECIDIYAPGDFIIPDINSVYGVKKTRGTSFAAPMVAGVAASIMSEHSEIDFNQESMKKTLIDMSIKDVIVGLGSEDTPNRFLNNGKKLIFSPDGYSTNCGISFGNATCSNGCCTKDGKCIPLNDDQVKKCLIEKGCQSEFGYCTTIDQSIEECYKELDKYEECQFIFMNEIDSQFLEELCYSFKSEKCQKFYKNYYTDQTICFLAKNYQPFPFADSFDIYKYREYNNICNNVYINRCEELMDTCNAVNNHDDDLITNYDIVKSKCSVFKSYDCQEFFLNGMYHLNECTMIDSPYYKKPNSDDFDQYYNSAIDICDKKIGNQEFIYNECRKALEEYEDCRINVDFNDNQNKNELIEKCNSYNLKCSNLKQKIPICKDVVNFEETFSLVKDIERILEFCNKKTSKTSLKTIPKIVTTSTNNISNTTPTFTTTFHSSKILSSTTMSLSTSNSSIMTEMIISTTTTSTSISATTTTYNSQTTNNCARQWEQCGGQEFNGPTCCQSGFICKYYNDYYSQCI